MRTFGVFVLGVLNIVFGLANAAIAFQLGTLFNTIMAVINLGVGTFCLYTLFRRY
jgi:hypothetical protein